ncbi:T6SS effector amidase Tae4 family protein, partial [Helicobacter trogontum]|uniref:T6SS effector amidase Tae4 family protein n=1 Tax=Helicobacter trogontum TaxID=50960 RepID=UPI000CF0945C
LLGSSESHNNPLFFGELDSKSEFRESKPIYHLIGEIDYDSKDSKESFTQTLQVFLDNNTLTLLNYSLLDSSLNIKLKCNSSESKAIQEREKAQRDKDSSSLAQNDKSQSTAMLHPILEDDEIKCPHNGVVKLKSNKGKNFKSKDIPMILESDLLNSFIIGCTNNIAGVPTPCTMVATILPNARGLKKFNDDYPIMQDLVSGNVFSDKGFPITCTPKPNTFKINSPKPIDSNTQNKQKLESQINLYRPTLRLHYKITPLQKDNLPIYRLKLNDSIIESNNDTPLDSITIDIAKDTKELSDTSNLSSSLQDILSSIYASLKETYTKGYKYHYLSLQLDSNALILILLIPQTIPKVFKEVYKNYEYKDYGIGKYHYLYNSCTHIMLDIQDYTQIGLDSNPSNATILTLHTPYKAQRLEIALANGLDSLIESKDRQRQTRESKESSTQSKQKDSQNNTKQQIIDSLLTLKIINGGYKEKYWSYGEEVEEKEIEEKIDISQGILIASNDDAIAYQALEEMSKKEKWRQLKTSYLAIHNITQTDIKMSRQRIGEKRLWDWIHSEDNYLEYGENEFIKAEIRYHKIGGPIYDVFLKTPHQYINTCAARISKALTDFGIVIKKLQGMKSNAYVANAGTNTKPYKILVRVEDMIDFLKLNDSLGEPIVFRPKANQTSDAFCKEVLSSLNANGIIAMIIAFRDAGGHVTLWDNDKGEFLDNVDNSDGVNYMNGRYNIREVYFWEIAR